MALALVATAFLAVLFGAAMIVAVVGFVLRAVVWLVLLPFQLLFFALGLPLLIVGLVGATVVAVVGGSLLVGASILAAVLGSVLFPIAVVVFVIWALVRLARRPATA